MIFLTTATRRQAAVLGNNRACASPPSTLARTLLLAALLLSAFSFQPSAFSASAPQLVVEGLGALKNRETRRTLERLVIPTPAPETLDSNAIEDALFILLSTLNDEGYQNPEITTTLTLLNGSQITDTFTRSADITLPRPIHITRARFQIEKNTRYTLNEIQFHGTLRTLGQRQAAAYFKPNNALIITPAARAYSPARLRNSADALRETLRHEGRLQATVTANVIKQNPANGYTDIVVTIDEGPLWQIASYTLSGTEKTPVYTDPDQRKKFQNTLEKFIGTPWSEFREQDLVQTIRETLYAQGYPDTLVDINPGKIPVPRQAAAEQSPNSTAPGSADILPADDSAAQLASPTAPLHLNINITPGPRVQIGNITFTGSPRSSQNMLKSRAKIKTDDWLDPIQLDQARNRLTRLNAYRAVDTRTSAGTPNAGASLDDARDNPPSKSDNSDVAQIAKSATAQPPLQTRDVEFLLADLHPWETAFLLGWGSYEQLRGGVELRQNNLWGLAHQSRLEFVQSVKSTTGEYAYTIPQIFNQPIDATLRFFGLRRKEESFDREEYGGTLSARKRITTLGADATVGYTFESLRNADNTLSTKPTDSPRTEVASLTLSLSRDRRDHPLVPRRGYRIFAQAEFAAKALGGEVNYQAFEFGASYHTRWTSTRWIHIGLTQGIITTLKGKAAEIPVNKRYFPGGDGSIRGYQRGEAAPRADDGKFAGAETYTLLNLEIEQAVTSAWSAVLFFDALGEAADIHANPFDEKLYTLGLGLRYQTLIGPIRLEYGRNLNPRKHDPGGTLHFSFGFPF